MGVKTHRSFLITGTKDWHEEVDDDTVAKLLTIVMEDAGLENVFVDVKTVKP